MGEVTVAVKKANVKEVNNQENVILKNGYHILIHKKFKKPSIQKLIHDYHDALEQLRKKEVIIENIDTRFIYYMLLLRHFTNLSNVPLEIEKMIIVCQKLIDLDLLDEIIGHFQENELEKIHSMISRLVSNDINFSK